MKNKNKIKFFKDCGNKPSDIKKINSMICIQNENRINLSLENADDPLEELNVIGCTVEEALSLTEKYLDQALVREQLSLRVIHGHGKGKLCQAIASLLKNHQQVARFSPAKPEHGGNGVTIIELRN